MQGYFKAWAHILPDFNYDGQKANEPIIPTLVYSTMACFDQSPISSG